MILYIGTTVLICWRQGWNFQPKRRVPKTIYIYINHRQQSSTPKDTFYLVDDTCEVDINLAQRPYLRMIFVGIFWYRSDFNQ